MEHFRIPRKKKKSLRGKFWLYPADEKGNSLMASPYRSQEDFNAYRDGSLRDMLVESRAERGDWYQKLDAPATISDDKLRTYVENVFAKEYRNASYQILNEAKDNLKAQKYYYNFINAYELSTDDDDHYNLCCMAVDFAQSVMREERKRRLRRKRKR